MSSEKLPAVRDRKSCARIDTDVKYYACAEEANVYTIGQEAGMIRQRSSLPRPIAFGVLTDLALTATDAMYAPAHAMLPLTGSHIGQLGACLVLGVIFCELKGLLKP